MSEHARYRIEMEFIKKHDFKKIIKQQSRLTFNGVHISYEKCDSYTFKHREVLMDKTSFCRICCIRIIKGTYA